MPTKFYKSSFIFIVVFSLLSASCIKKREAIKRLSGIYQLQIYNCEQVEKDTVVILKENRKYEVKNTINNKILMK